MMHQIRLTSKKEIFCNKSKFQSHSSSYLNNHHGQGSWLHEERLKWEFFLANKNLYAFLGYEKEDSKNINFYYNKFPKAYLHLLAKQIDDIYQYLFRLTPKAVKSSVISALVPVFNVMDNLLWILIRNQIISYDQEQKKLCYTQSYQNVTSYAHKNCLETTIGFQKNNNFVIRFYEKYYPVKGHHEFSSREIEILKMLADGMTSQLVADQLHLSVKTVYTHRQKILAKARVKNTHELVYYAKKYHVI